MTTETKLLPCPFCGAQPEITPWHQYSDVVVIHCTNEECDVGAETSAVGRELAVIAWNKRALSPPEPTEGVRAALTLAEDVLSRAPFSTDIWSNGMHPNEGIALIRAALRAMPLQDGAKR